MIMSIWYTVYRVLDSYSNDRERHVLLTIFFCIILCSMGTFILQISPHGFYGVTIFGLLSNRFLTKEEFNE